MGLLILWGIFVLISSFSEELGLYYYTFFSSLMFFITYFYNQINYINTSFRFGLTLFNVPIFILWYVAFIFNDFLAINPISYKMFMNLFFSYSYLILYLFFNYQQLKDVYYHKEQ